MSNKAILLFWPALLWCLCGTLASGKEYWNYKTAYDAYDAGEFLLAADMYKRLADKGDARAQNDLGFMYTVGQGVPQDFKTAATWFRKAAAQGHPPALLHLAALHDDGRGVAKSAVEAHKYYTLAALLTRNANRKTIATTRRDAIEAGLSAAQLVTARKRTCLWWRTHRAELAKHSRPARDLLQYCAGE